MKIVFKYVQFIKINSYRKKLRQIGMSHKVATLENVNIKCYTIHSVLPNVQ
jgi:hypothetical protein